MGNHEAVRHEPGVADLILRGLLLVMALFGICILIRPQGLVADNGLSYYGNYWDTLLPYAGALLISCLVYWNSADRIAASFSRHKNLFALGLRAMSVLCIGLLLTPRSWLDPLHIIFGSALFGMQFIISLVLAYAFHGERWLLLLATVQTASGLAALYYLPKSTGWLLEMQIIFQLAFGFLLYRALVLSAVNRLKPIAPDQDI